jgi:hypothetical protein
MPLELARKMANASRATEIHLLRVMLRISISITNFALAEVFKIVASGSKVVESAQ